MNQSLRTMRTLLGVAVFLAITAMSCGAMADLTLSADTTQSTAEQGAMTTLDFEVERQGFTGGVDLAASSSDDGITATADPTTLASGETRGSVEVAVASTVAEGTYDVTVDAEATADGSTVSNSLTNVLATYDESVDADADGQATFDYPGATDSEQAELDFVTQTSGGVESPAQKFNCSGEVN